MHKQKDLAKLIGATEANVSRLLSGDDRYTTKSMYNPQNEACGTSQTKRAPRHPVEKKRSVTFSGNIPRAFGNHPNALLASVK